MALTLQTLLLRVQQSCAKHGAELPPTVQEWAQLPQPTAGELANRLRLQWLRGGSAPLDWQWQVLLWVIDQDWAELALRQRLNSDLLAPWLRGHAALGRRFRLAEFQAAAGPVLAEPALLPQAMLVLRALRTVGAVQATRRLVEQLLGSVEPEAACLPELARSVAMVSRQAEGLPALQWAGACLARWLPLVSGPAFPPRHWPPGDAQGFLVALGVIANRTVDCDALRLLGAHLCTLDRSPELEAVLGGMLSTLASFDAGEGSFELLELAGRRLPDSAVVQLERARAALARGASLATLGAMLMPLDAAAPGFRSAMSWLANHLFHSDLIPQAVQVLERLEQAQLLNEADRLRLQHLRARGLADLASGAAAGEPLDRLRLAERAFEGLPSSFAPLTSLIALAPVHDAQDTLSQWALRCESVAQAFATELSQARARGEGTALHVSVAAARQLMQIGEELYSTHTVALDLVPFPLTVAYGRIDPLRCRCVFATLNRALSSLFEELLDQARPFASVSGESGLKDWLTLMRMACEAWLQLDQPERSLALLESARQKLGPGLGRSHVQLLMERVRLAQGDMLGAAKERAAMSQDSDALELPQRPWHEWVEGESASLETWTHDEPIAGEFETVQPDGRVLRYPHATLPVDMQAAQFHQVSLRLSYALIGSAAGMLMPPVSDRWRGAYPGLHVDVLNRALRGATLRRAREVRQVSEPVIVLAHFDMLLHRNNYYHWVLFLLARAAWLRSHGHLDDRRLMVPQELPAWAFSSLSLVGVDDSRLMRYGESETLVLADAWVVSPQEFPSRSLCDPLSETLWQAAGLDPRQPPERDKLIYITRGEQNRRPLVEETPISEMARAMGFEVVAPERLSLLDQVRLFARARAIVSPPGAALANLLWTQPGTKLLVIFKEEGAPPTFVDVALVRGLRYRWLMGRNLPEFELSNIVNAPFSVDLALARRELTWAASNED